MDRRQVLTRISLTFVLGMTSAIALVEVNAAPLSAATALSISTPTYVALGDSYASGEGIPGARPDQWLSAFGTPWLSKDGCDRSALSYPMLVAKAEGVTENFKFVACSGAVTGSPSDASSFTNGVGSLVNGSNGEPSQLQALSSTNTTTVSLTIGGDDLGFATLLKDCMGWMVKEGPLSYVSSSSAPGASPAACNSALSEAQSIASSSPGNNPSLESALIDTYTQILNAAPRATLFVSTYPQLFTTATVSRFCPLTGALRIGRTSFYLGLNPAQVTAFNGIEAGLNSSIEAAAQQVNQTLGANRIDVVNINSLTTMDGQTCNTKNMSTSIINGVLFATGDSLSTLYGDCFHGKDAVISRCKKAPSAASNNFIAKGSMHPKPVGQAMIATALTVAIGASVGPVQPIGPSWSAPRSIDQGAALKSVSCTSTTFCMAADSNGNVLAYDGENWSISTSTGNLLGAVSWAVSRGERNTW